MRCSAKWYESTPAPVLDPMRQAANQRTTGNEAMTKSDEKPDSIGSGGRSPAGAGARDIRTSQTHPLRIDEVEAGAAGGRIGITFCPGKIDDTGYRARWARDLAADLDVISLWRPAAMVTLIEDHEFRMLGVPQLGEQVRHRGLEWHHLPIVDVQPPDERFEVAWQSSGPKLVGYLRAGGRVLVHCRGGLGRAGMVAARLLVELDVTPVAAIERVRQARPGAIETLQQETYVRNLARERRT